MWSLERQSSPYSYCCIPFKNFRTQCIIFARWAVSLLLSFREHYSHLLYVNGIPGTVTSDIYMEHNFEWCLLKSCSPEECWGGWENQDKRIGGGNLQASWLVLWRILTDATLKSVILACNFKLNTDNKIIRFKIEWTW